jgi:hypothetical protein
MRNPSGKVVYDRRFNTAALLATYYGSNVDFAGRIDWDPKVGANMVARTYQCQASGIRGSVLLGPFMHGSNVASHSALPGTPRLVQL